MKHSFNCLSYELLLYVLICIPFCSCSQKDTGVISPNGKICLSVEIKEDTEKDGFGKVFFNVEYKMVKLPEGFYLIPELAWKPSLCHLPITSG